MGEGEGGRWDGVRGGTKASGDLMHMYGQMALLETTIKQRVT